MLLTLHTEQLSASSISLPPLSHLSPRLSLSLSQVSTQLAVLMARIARIDCPDQWPELLPLLTKVTMVTTCAYSNM